MNKLALSLARSLGVAGVALVGSYVPGMAQAADTIVTREVYSSPAPVVRKHPHAMRPVRPLLAGSARDDAEDRRALRRRAPRSSHRVRQAVVQRRVIEQPVETYVERPAATYPADTYYREAPAATYYGTAPGVTVWGEYVLMRCN